MILGMSFVVGSSRWKGEDVEGPLQSVIEEIKSNIFQIKGDPIESIKHTAILTATR